MDPLELEFQAVVNLQMQQLGTELHSVETAAKCEEPRAFWPAPGLGLVYTAQDLSHRMMSVFSAPVT